MSVESAKPFLKWAGGKVWLATSASTLAPRSFKRYFEPFLGGGAMFFALSPREATLSDSNADLIATYQEVRRDPASVVRALRQHHYSREHFYRVRASTPRSAHGAAARFVFLNRTAWNGLYRVNRAGRFNVPFGDFADPLGTIGSRILSASRTLKGVRLQACDFAYALAECRRGDFAYLDPPYVSRHRLNGFLRYNATVFSWTDQERLEEAVRRLDRRGIQFLLSNADHPSIAALYRGFLIRRISRQSLVAGSNQHRSAVTELLISNYDPPGRLDG